MWFLMWYYSECIKCKKTKTINKVLSKHCDSCYKEVNKNGNGKRETKLF